MADICVDFDGTCVDHRYPDVGRDVPGVVSALKFLVASGHNIVLFTMRGGKELDDAVRWFQERDIPLYGVNKNPTQDQWTTSPKAYGRVYIDDAAVGCPLINVAGFARPCVDWDTVLEILGASRRLR